MKTTKTILILGLGLLISACGAGKSQNLANVEQAAMHYRVAQDLLLKGETTRAMAELHRAEKLSDKEPEIHNLFGLAYLQLAETDQAQARFEKAIELDPEYSEAHNHLAVILIEKKEYDKAIVHARKAVENLNYTTPERAYHNMGIAYRRKGDLNSAINAFQKALLHNANFVMSRNELGQILMEKEKYTQAAGVLKPASATCDASPQGVWQDECPQAYYNLARVYVKLKKRNQAVAAFRNCVKADDREGAYAQKCRSNLEILQ